MPLTIGARLGAYEIIGPLGAGGMGEVYRARDTALERDVALKVLPDLFARDPDRLARFRREARILASLNHSNVATIHGLEEADGILALVLELVDGHTLADRISQGAVPIGEALSIAGQITDALEAAHEQGITHRDLKPANIVLRPDGVVKVLDFGLAKALEAQPTGDVSQSLTTTSPAMTRMGVILGTAAYMSPEQAKGKPVDKRTDIWAFGCVLYEMLTGRSAFAGETMTDLIAAVVTKEPDWTALPPTSPPAVVRLLRRCLTKDPRERLRDIGDARIELGMDLPEPEARARKPVPVALIGAATLAGILAGALVALGIQSWLGSSARAPTVSTAPMTHMAIDLPADAPLALGSNVPVVGFDSPVVALAPDGRNLAYVGRTDTGTMLYLRSMASLEIVPIAGTEGATFSFFSPDGRWLGFLTNDKVKKVALDGGAAVTLCNASIPVRASWTHDDAIYFSESEGFVLSRVPAAGGRPTQVANGAMNGNLLFSDVLPDGKWALATRPFRAGISQDFADIVLLSLDTHESKLLIRSGYDARYVLPGYLLFARSGSLLAVPFDASSRLVVGEPVPIVANVAMASLFGQAHAAAAASGVIAYVQGGDLSAGRLAWVDRRGNTEYLPVPTRIYGVVDLSPDGNRLAVHVADVADYIWIYEIGRREGRRLSSTEPNGWPVWSPDSRKIAMTSWHPEQADQTWRILTRAVDGVGNPDELLSADAGLACPSAWSPDGSVVGATVVRAHFALAFLPKEREPQWAATGDFNQWGTDFSPDGRFVAYSSNESGQYEVWVRSYPDGELARQISTDGGLEPVWCACGELFYRKGNQWLSSKVTLEPELRWEPPRLVFETDFIDTPGRSYDVSPDGQRLLVVKRVEHDTPTRIQVVSNWTEMLKRPAATPD